MLSGKYLVCGSQPHRRVDNGGQSQWRSGTTATDLSRVIGVVDDSLRLDLFETSSHSGASIEAMGR